MTSQQLLLETRTRGLICNLGIDEANALISAFVASGRSPMRVCRLYSGVRPSPTAVRYAVAIGRDDLF